MRALWRVMRTAKRRSIPFITCLTVALFAHAGGANAATCTAASPGAAQWQNIGFTPQTGVFTMTLRATPKASPGDTLVALAQGPQSRWSGLAAIVRFNNAGTIDVRDGGVYRADRAFNYYAGMTVYLRISVDMATKTYSVYVREYGVGTWYNLATDYMFRTEQQAVSQLDTFVTEAEIGDITSCVNEPYPWVEATPGAAQWQNRGLWGNVISDAPGRVMSWEVRPMAANSDALFALSYGPQTFWSGLATIVRFNSSGTIDVRNGDHYTADNVVAYQPNRTYRIHMYVGMRGDESTGYDHRYSVDIRLPTGEVVPIARYYRFRTEQQNIPRLNNWVLEAEQGGIRGSLLENFDP